MDYSLLGKQPISADKPTGSDISYEEIFEQLKAEIDKLGSPSGRDTFEWEKVAKLASNILNEHSKDLRVASYFCVALVHIDKLKGFDTALTVYSDLLYSFWDKLFPATKYIRRRTQTIDWWIDKTTIAITSLDLSSGSKEQIERIQTNLEKIRKFIEDNIKENPPCVEPIIKNIKEKIQGLKLDKNQVPKSITQETSKQDQVYENTDSDKSAKKNLASAFKAIQQVAKFVRQTNPQNPQPYKWSRIAAWEPVEFLPIAQNEKTKIPLPGSLNTLIKLREKQDWKSLLDAAEEKIYESGSTFLLDINRYVAEALSKLGNEYEIAHETVCQETFYFLNRLPGLDKLHFSDGTPFADRETKLWIGNLKTKYIPKSINKYSSVQTKPDKDKESIDIIAKGLDAANQLVKNNKLLEAVETIQNRIYKSFSKREAFLWKIGLIEILLEKDLEVSLVIPHIEELLYNIEKFHLEEWEPDLALESIERVYMICKIQPQQEYKAKTSQLLSKISKLNPMLAIGL